MSHPVKLVPPSSSEERSTKKVVTMSNDETLILEINKVEDGLNMRSTTQPLTLTITMDENGPTVQLSHANLQLDSLGDVSIEGDNINLKGRESCSIETEGDFKVRADEKMTLKSTEDCVVKARVIHLN